MILPSINAANDENILTVLNDSNSYLEEIKSLVINDQTSDLLSINQETLDEIKQILNKQVDYTFSSRLEQKAQQRRDQEKEQSMFPVPFQEQQTLQTVPEINQTTEAAGVIPVQKLVDTIQTLIDTVQAAPPGTVNNVVENQKDIVKLTEKTTNQVLLNQDTLSDIETNTEDLKKLDAVIDTLNKQVELEKTAEDLLRLQIENQENSRIEQELERERAERLARQGQSRASAGQEDQGEGRGGNAFANMLGVGAGGAGLGAALSAGFRNAFSRAVRGGGLIGLAAVFGDEIGEFLGENVSSILTNLGVNPDFAKNLEDILKSRTTAALTMAGLSKVILGRTLPGIVVEGLLAFFDLPSLTDPKKLLDALELKIKENFGEGAANNFAAATGTAQEIATIIAGQIYKLFGLEELVPQEKRDEVNKMFEDAFSSFLDRETVQDILSIPARILDGTLKDDIVAAGVTLAESMGSLLTNVSTAFGNKLRDQSHDSAFQGGVSRENRMRMRSRFNNYGQGEYASDEEISRAIVSEENETTPPAAPSGSTSVIARIAGMILGNNDENMDSLERAGGPSPRMRLSMDANYARAQRDATSAEELEQMPTADNNYNFDQAFDQLPVDPAFDLMDSTPESDANFQRILDRMDAAPDLLAATATPVTSAIPTGSNLLQQGLELEGIDDPVFKELARSIFHQETSGGTNVRRSSAGAIGPMQILPGTFNEVADPGMDINNPLDNMRAGIRYLLKGYKAAGRDPMGAAAFYYGGGGGLQSLSDPSRDPRPGSGGPTVSEYASQVVNRMQAQARGYGIERLDMGISSSVVPSLQPNQVSQLSQDLNRRSQVAVIQPIINNIVNNNNNSTNTSVANSRSGSSGAGRSYNIDRTLMNIVNNRTLSPA